MTTDSKPQGKSHNKTMVIFVAHADDTEFAAGGTIAKLTSEGWEVTEVIATDNSRGSFELDAQATAKASRVEAIEAARILAKKDVIFLDYPDGFLGDTPLNELREKFIRIIRELKPHAIMTWDPFAPYETHPDHRQVAFAATEAAGFAHFPLFHPEHMEDGLDIHFVVEKYFFAKSPFGKQTRVDISKFIDKKIDSLCAHDSQMKLTVDDLELTFKAVNPNHPMLKMIDRNNYRPTLEMIIKMMCSELAKDEDYQYAETFRIERAGGLAGMVGGEAE